MRGGFHLSVRVGFHFSVGVVAVAMDGVEDVFSESQNGQNDRVACTMVSCSLPPPSLLDLRI